jgi:DNA repair protein RAD50
MNLESELATLQDDMEERRTRMKKITSEIEAANYDRRLKENADRQTGLEEQQQELTAEFKSLSGQSDLRSKVDLQKKEIKTKTAEMNKT